MLDLLKQQHQEIQTCLESFFKNKAAELSLINRWGPDLCRRLKEFTSGGKMIRGKLVVLSFMMFGESPDQEVIRAAAALELLHSAFLIHDDIMDRDKTRRGLPTIFSQYHRLGETEHFPDAYHFGESMGICAGDMAIFSAYEILTSLKVSPLIRQRVLSLFTKEITCVAVAQMQDVYLGSWRGELNEETIYNLYLYKTGRYTFSLPLMMGALLADRGSDILSSLEEIGEYLGIIFQIRDDELGLYGDEEKIGKPVGSDIKEEKKTFYYLYLIQRANDKQRVKLAGILGNKNLNTADLEYVHNLIVDLGIRKLINEKVSALAAKARTLINSLSGIREKYRVILLDILEYNLKRNR